MDRRREEQAESQNQKSGKITVTEMMRRRLESARGVSRDSRVPYYFRCIVRMIFLSRMHATI